MLNKVILIGRVANDPELKYTPNGVAVSTFRVAVNRPFLNKQEEREADFIDVVAWRQAAEFAANYLGKGHLIAVEGRLQIRSYQSQDGVRRRVAEVVCENLKALSKPRDSGGDGGGGGGMTSHMGGGHMDEPPAFEDPFQDE